MNIEQNPQEKPAPVLCIQCQTFYGAQAFQGLCSTCHKKQSATAQPQALKQEKTVETPQMTATPGSVIEQEVLQGLQQLSLEPTKVQQKDKTRCMDCKKKVGLLGIECKCGFVYCNKHRLPQEHKCKFDHSGCGKNKLKNEIVKVAKSKIESI